MLTLLEDPNLRVAVFRGDGVGEARAVPRRCRAILKMIRENADKDVYLRHAGVTALTWIKNWDAIATAARDESRSVRMASLLTMRRLERPDDRGISA